VSGKTAPPPEAGDILRRIERMTRLVRSAAVFGLAGGAPGAAGGGGETSARPDAQPGAWWVLAQGRILDPGNFTAREAAREDLLESVRQAGVFVQENVWVWDETGRAQLVLATLPTRERALRVAERLRAKGLNIAVRPEMPQRPDPEP
jgi:hypothetical protein